MIPESLQNNAEVFGVLLLGLGVDKDVVNEHNYKLIQLWHEHGIHQIHEVGSSIGETKRHDKIFKKTTSRGESSLWNVFGSDLYLVITGSEVNLGEYQFEVEGTCS